MIVMGANGDRLGTVKKVDEDGLWIDLEARPDTRVPFPAIQEVVEEFVRLNIPGDQLDRTGIADEGTHFKPVTGGA